ncbi:SDR family NAD(P)-dependent oxidoreductase [uncultured Shimia sp.]|uniref:SDR family NAD(P)-dependent oxidoreductase n=1 Tax=uncultured Shimia sp. TaxID=573152 RepID=UPI0026269BF5|nr:SDR family NAD(P)-dependent oxidoreductase [uncultured Shimia sp.]
MTTPLTPPPKKNPLKRSLTPTSPPGVRSRATLGLTAAAAEGRFMLQTCAECGTVQYPPRDACCKCLSVDLPWKDISPTGTLLAESTVRTSTNLYFRERAPWRLGSVQLDAGPTIICHVHGDVAPKSRVILSNRLDRSGQGVMMALPEQRTPDMEDDPELRAMSSDPKHRRVLITDARNPNAPTLAKALHDAGATMIFVGEAESWLPNPQRDALTAIPGVEIMALDVTDTTSVKELAGEIGGKLDILINNAQFVRPGGAMARGDVGFAQDEMEVNYFGLMRLAQAFGPGMCSRTADGVNSAVAWVNILSAYALVNSADYGCFSASNAAAYSLSQNLRNDFRASGLRVMNVFVGPTEDDWHQELPPPKVLPPAVARSVVQGLKDGLEDVYCGDVAKDMIERFRAGPKILEREMTKGQQG